MYLVSVEVVLKDHLILKIWHHLTNHRVYALVENVYRPSELMKDFPHMYPRSYQTEEEFKNDNACYDLIRIQLFPAFKEDEIDDVMMSEFVLMAESLVEHRLETAHAVIINYDCKFRRLLMSYDYKHPKKSLEKCYKYLLSCAENPPELRGDIYHFGHF